MVSNRPQLCSVFLPFLTIGGASLVIKLSVFRLERRRFLDICKYVPPRHVENDDMRCYVVGQASNIANGYFQALRLAAIQPYLVHH